MSQAMLPASAMICLYGGAAMKPRFASSKSRSSWNGSVARWPSRSSTVNFEGGFPFGWKCLPSVAPGSLGALVPPAATAAPLAARPAVAIAILRMSVALPRKSIALRLASSACTGWLRVRQPVVDFKCNGSHL